MLRQSPFSGIRLIVVVIEIANVFPRSPVRRSFLLQLPPCNIQPTKDFTQSLVHRSRFGSRPGSSIFRSPRLNHEAAFPLQRNQRLLTSDEALLGVLNRRFRSRNLHVCGLCSDRTTYWQILKGEPIVCQVQEEVSRSGLVYRESSVDLYRSIPPVLRLTKPRACRFLEMDLSRWQWLLWSSSLLLVE